MIHVSNHLEILETIRVNQTRAMHQAIHYVRVKPYEASPIRSRPNADNPLCGAR